MWTSIRNIALVFLCGVILSGYAIAQPANNAKERICTMKKMKMLETLDLDEKKSDEFLVKFNAWEKKIDEQRRIIDGAGDNLKNSIKSGSDDDVQKNTDKFMEAQNKLWDLYSQKLKAMKSILSAKEYAKYVLFEDRFTKELQKAIFKRGKCVSNSPEGNCNEQPGKVKRRNLNKPSDAPEPPQE